MWEYKISIHDINEAPNRKSSAALANCYDRIAHLNRCGETCGNSWTQPSRQARLVNIGSITGRAE